jgi:hypothetical protein
LAIKVIAISAPMIGFRRHPAAKRMDAQGFVSKNAGLEKADRKKDAPGLIRKVT